MNAYFDIIKQLICMMMFITLVIFPVFWTYMSYHGLQNQPGFVINQFSLGNLGGAQTICAQGP